MFSAGFFKSVRQCPEMLSNSRKLDLALRPSNVTEMIREIDNKEINLSLNCQILLNNLGNTRLADCTRSPTLWPTLLSRILAKASQGQDLRSRKSDKLTTTFGLIRQNMELQHNCMTQNNLSLSEDMRSQFDEWNRRVNMSDPLLRNLAALEEELGELVEMAMSLEHRLHDRKYRENISHMRQDTRHTLRTFDLRVIWCKTVSVWYYEGDTWALPLDYVLLMHNKTCDLLSSLLLLQGASGTCYEPDAYQLGVRFVTALAHLAVTHPGFFDLAKSLEGLVIAEVLTEEDEWYNDTLKKNIASDLQTKNYIYSGSEIEHILKSASTPLKHELGGLAKICGHPLIDIPETAAAAHTRAIQEKDVDYVAIMSTRNIAVESFIRSYILKEHKWPPVEIDDETPEYIREAHRIGLDPNSRRITKKYGKGHHDDYIHVELTQVKSLDKLDHYSQYLKDRAISTLRDRSTAYYINKTIQSLPWEEGRLLLIHLFTSEAEHDLLGYLKDYMESSNEMEYVLNYLTIKLVPKEKELKVVGRPFGCKTYADRYRSYLQEENVKSYLHDFCSDQAMTLDNLTLIRRMHAFRNLRQVYTGWRVLYINFDVSGWCGNFRHETVEPIAHDVLDKVFGTSHFFDKTQKAFEKGFFYLPDREGVYHWEGQDGGIEGLNQYTWMTVYIPQMQLALREYQLQFFVMCYGDDYKAAILIPLDQRDVDMEVLKSRIVSGVSERVRVSFGQKMKI